MNRPVLDHRPVDLKWKEVADNLEPRGAAAGLRFALRGGVDKLNLRLSQQQATNYPAMEKSVPINGEIDALGRKERDGNVARCLADANVVNRISPAPQMDLHLANVSCVERMAIQCAIDVI